MSNFCTDLCGTQSVNAVTTEVLHTPEEESISERTIERLHILKYDRKSKIDLRLKSFSLYTFYHLKSFLSC